MTAAIDGIPVYGSGIGYRQQISEQLIAERASLDCIEIVTEHFLHPATHDHLAALNARIPAIPHGLGLSIGSAATSHDDYLEAIRQVCNLVRAPYYTEHLCMTQAPGIDLGHLAPIPFTEESLTLVIDKVARVQDFLGRPLVLENVTYYFDVPCATLTPGDFFSGLTERTGCGLLLDLANLHINATNHNFDPFELLSTLPLDRVVHVHLAGGYWKEGWLMDGHNSDVDQRVWDLLAWLAKQVTIKTCILERDANFPDELSGLLDQVATARRLMEKQP